MIFLYFLYFLFLTIAFLPVLFLALILAPVLPLLASDEYGPLDNNGTLGYGPRLLVWLNWFMTPDNSLYGDSTFITLNGISYWSMVKWLWRNPAYAFGMLYIDSQLPTVWYGDRTIKDNDNAKAGWCFVTAAGLFQFTWVRPIGFNRCIYVNLGWNIRALVDPNVTSHPLNYQATWVCSPRLSGFR